jgi:hypothetical protein
MKGRWLFLLGFVITSTSCSSGSPPSTPGANSCADQYDCGSGKSCGTTDGTTFICSTSGASNEGDACNANQGLPLQCGDHLFCLGINDVGTCRRWCSDGDACPSGSCTTVTTTHGAVISFCLPSTTPAADSCGAEYNCPAGQSCGTMDGTTLFCSTSGDGKEGDACDASQALPFQCGDHLLCLGVNGVGACHRWCSANDACPAGSCTMVTTTHGLAIHVCI